MPCRTVTEDFVDYWKYIFAGAFSVARSPTKSSESVLYPHPIALPKMISRSLIGVTEQPAAGRGGLSVNREKIIMASGNQGNKQGSNQGGNSQSSGTRNRGFASMDPARQREIASQGGKAAHAKGTAHEFTPDEARVAGKKGGEVVSRDRDHMARIGREGGQARAGNVRARSAQSSTQHEQPEAPPEGMQAAEEE